MTTGWIGNGLLPTSRVCSLTRCLHLNEMVKGLSNAEREKGRLYGLEQGGVQCDVEPVGGLQVFCQATFRS